MERFQVINVSSTSFGRSIIFCCVCFCSGNILSSHAFAYSLGSKGLSAAINGKLSPRATTPALIRW